jgi:hypothetical protein
MNGTERAGIGWRKGWVKRKDADKDKEEILVARRNGRWGEGGHEVMLEPERVCLNLARYLDESSSGEAENWAERMREFQKHLQLHEVGHVMWSKVQGEM